MLDSVLSFLGLIPGWVVIMFLCKMFLSLPRCRNQGCHGQGKVREIYKFFKVREKVRENLRSL